MKTFSAYIMMCGAQEVPEQNGLTKSECIKYIVDMSFNYDLDVILHIESDNWPHEITTRDVSEEMFKAAFNEVVHDGFIVNYYRGTLGALVEEHNDNLPQSQAEYDACEADNYRDIIEER